nr:MAG TPA: hypothetical protein [Caudoviricetes sp.]
MPRIKDYPKYEDHVDKTMTWDKSNKELLPPGRTKLLQDGRFIFDMDDGTYTVSMKYFIENVLGLVNKDKKTIISDITFDSEKVSFDIYKESIDIDGNSTGHKTKVSCSLAMPLLGLLWNTHALMGLNWETITNDGFLKVRLPYGKFSGMASHDVEIPLNAITNISVTDGKLTYKVGDDTKTLDLTSVINNTVNNSGELQQKVSDLVDFRMSPMTPLINSAITSINVSDSGNMKWNSYDGNTVEGSYDFGAFVDKKLAASKPADLPKDLTRNLNITGQGVVTWTVNGENKSSNLAASISNIVNGVVSRQIFNVSQKVNDAVVNLNIDQSGNATWSSNGQKHSFNISSLINTKVSDIKSDVTSLKYNITNINNGMSAHRNDIENLKSFTGKSVKDFTVNSDGVMTWTDGSNEKHTINLKSFVTTPSVSVEAIPSDTIQDILKG